MEGSSAIAGASLGGEAMFESRRILGNGEKLLCKEISKEIEFQKACFLFAKYQSGRYK